MRKEIIADTRISAAPRTIWAPLLDFSAYAAWNPLIPQAACDGEPRTGQRITLRYCPPGLRARDARAELLRVLPGQELSWLQRWLPVAGLLDMEHRFILESEPDPEQGTRLLQRVRFSGTLVPLFWWRLRGPWQQGAMALNRALRDEALSAAPDAPGG
ncbi:MAG: SRPBCC domain-containing protein [Ectothiorhodospiraceae bacterium]|nr:SRPBCC domain-containing protein [Ectothiorhodospiraceae bacterium]